MQPELTYFLHWNLSARMTVLLYLLVDFGLKNPRAPSDDLIVPSRVADLGKASTGHLLLVENELDPKIADNALKYAENQDTISEKFELEGCSFRSSSSPCCKGTCYRGQGTASTIYRLGTALTPWREADDSSRAWRSACQALTRPLIQGLKR